MEVVARAGDASAFRDPHKLVQRVDHVNLSENRRFYPFHFSMTIGNKTIIQIQNLELIMLEAGVWICLRKGSPVPEKEVKNEEVL